MPAAAAAQRLLAASTKIIGVGRNYIAHSKELGNPVPKEPVLFLKPTSSFLHAGVATAAVEIPEPLESLHHEVELAVVISRRLLSPPSATAAARRAAPVAAEAVSSGGGVLLPRGGVAGVAANGWSGSGPGLRLARRLCTYDERDDRALEEEVEKKFGWILKIIFLGTAGLVGYQFFPYMEDLPGDVWVTSPAMAVLGAELPQGNYVPVEELVPVEIEAKLEGGLCSGRRTAGQAWSAAWSGGLEYLDSGVRLSTGDEVERLSTGDEAERLSTGRRRQPGVAWTGGL
ncbi:Fumarylacetoacetate (FAA) hydrolase family [Zea mays]|uniref:Fumarylacetoacetate (FAA) hydrolase family n=1 Tax=Zea mays TaxID=4577 RepID=A0A1D6LD04_MAIZE|nr:Fumarylacetoacetate (FAA) hydrolase family [Zea mays]